MTRTVKPATRHSCRDCNNSAGPTVAMCRIDTRWSAGDAERIRKYVAEFVAFLPDVIVASGSATVGPLLQATRTVPIVFVNVPDPVGAGYVESLARPGGNSTGFILFQYGVNGHLG